MRRGGHGSGGRSLALANLRRRLESIKGDYSTVEEIVRYLRANLPEYRRIKQQPLSNSVRKALESSPRRARTSQSEQKHEDELKRGAGPSRKPGEGEERLQRMEIKHVRKRESQSSQDGSLLSSSSPEDSDEDDDEEDGGLSTSEDAVYEEKVEQELDLMKNMLRESYSESRSLRRKRDNKILEEKNIEIDVTNKKMKTVNDTVSAGDVKVELKNLGSCRNEKGPRFKDFGGMKEVLVWLKKKVIFPLCHPQHPLIQRKLGVRPKKGILLHGPPGCGKTKLARAIANEAGIPFYQIAATEVVSGVSGASEENIRDLFAMAQRTAPSIVFIDEVDVIASKRENHQRDMERRIVTQLMICMDESHNPESKEKSAKDGYVLVIGATNRPDAVDPALRRSGRFSCEIALGIPDENARLQILLVLTSTVELEGSVDLQKIARSTPSFVGADLEALVSEAGEIALEKTLAEKELELSGGDSMEEWLRIRLSPEEMEKLSITMADFEEALKRIQPSSKREGFSSLPNVKWEDVGGLDSLRQEFNFDIISPIKDPEKHKKRPSAMEVGFLLFGPPGCGKTLVAKAVANEAGASFIHIKGPELLNMYVGESERALRTKFKHARTCAPCIIFFDEVDAVAKQRGTEGASVIDRLLTQFLTELHGGDDRHGVFVIGATNRIQAVDRALLRPGRFGKLYYVGLPNAHERGLILKALGRRETFDAGVDLSAIGQMEACENFSGADLASLMAEAAKLALREDLASGVDSDSPWPIKTVHFSQALTKISPSVSKRDIRVYEKKAKKLNAAR